MKKSFKKAGAAVLSMAMLLSMGAVSLPVYAADPTNWPGQVKVIINGNGTSDTTATQGWADDSWTYDDGETETSKTREFNYLSDVTNATVKMYRVATLGTNGWEWTSDFASAVNTYYNGDSTKLNDFEKLLATEEGTDNKEHFTATSAELLQVASALERAARQSSPTISPLTSGTLTVTNGVGELYLPGDDDLDTMTKDTIGYYLITTTTNDAGVVLQPVLITLKNSKTGENPVEVALKGYEINVSKTITAVVDKDENVSLGGEVISGTGNTAVVAKDDKITYQIVTQIPTYDVKLDATATGATAMKKFIITDTPDSGIIAVQGVTADGGGTTYDVPTLVVTADDDTTDTTPAVTLVKNSDYILNANENGTFTIEFLPTKYHTAENTTGKKLEGQVITVTFTATVDENLRRENNSSATYADLTAGDVDAQATSDTVTKNTTYTNASTANASNAIQTAVATLLHGTEATYSSVTEQEWVAAYLAAQAESTVPEVANYGTALTAEKIAAKMDDAKAVIAAHNAYVAAQTTAGTDFGAEQTDNIAALKKVLSVGDSTDLTDAQKLQAVLALNAMKAEKVGNDNVADINYGNEYSTGQGNGNDTDKATVYSVDLDLTKITETLTLTDQKEPSDATDDDKDTWYDVAESEETYVANAVFDLIKVNNSSVTTANNKSVGLAVSDEHGKLWMLTAQDTAPASGATVTLKYTSPATGTEGEEGYVAPKYYVLENDEESRKPAWIELTKGDYILRELSAPAGYKKFSDVSITIDPKTTSTTVGEGEGATTITEYNGNFAATTTDTTGTVVQKKDDKQIVYSGVDGALQAKIINPQADTLPATGGIGTVLFTAGGISVVLIAGALFVMYMKKRNAEDEE